MSDRDCEKCKHHTEKGCDRWDCEFEQGMTRKDAIKRLKLWLICSEEYTEDDVSMNEAIRIAINSLEIDERYELEYENAEEIHKGRWIKISSADIYECSECGQNVMTADICAYRYCHGCGAKMTESEGKHG